MKKVKNNSGATILMALLLILLATAVGAAVLTAAVSAARHLRSDREAQQNYLTVSSAAELIRDSINGQTYERTLTKHYKYVETTDDDGKVTGDYVHDYTDIVQTPSGGKIGGIMGAWLADCIADKSEITKDFASFQKCEDTITVTVDAGEGSLRTVQAKFSAEPRTTTLEGKVLYRSDIRVELSLAPENGKADDCRMTLTMQGTLTKTEEYRSDVNGYSNTYKTTVTWGSPIIKKGIGTKEAGT